MYSANKNKRYLQTSAQKITGHATISSPEGVPGKRIAG
jgi:hypothetical protein